MKQNKKSEGPVTGEPYTPELNNTDTVIEWLERAGIKPFHLLLALYGLIIASGILYRAS